MITKSDGGNELWLEMGTKFRRGILRRDRDGGPQLIAMPAGQFSFDPARVRGTVEDSGPYELIEGSDRLQRFDLWFSGKVMRGEWRLAKIEKGEAHRSWRLAPVR
jgi:hypothetical protein